MLVNWAFELDKVVVDLAALEILEALGLVHLEFEVVEPAVAVAVDHSFVALVAAAVVVAVEGAFDHLFDLELEAAVVDAVDFVEASFAALEHYSLAVARSYLSVHQDHFAKYVAAKIKSESSNKCFH